MNAAAAGALQAERDMMKKVDDGFQPSIVELAPHGLLEHASAIFFSSSVPVTLVRASCPIFFRTSMAARETILARVLPGAEEHKQKRRQAPRSRRAFSAV